MAIGSLIWTQGPAPSNTSAKFGRRTERCFGVQKASTSICNAYRAKCTTKRCTHSSCRNCSLVSRRKPIEPPRDAKKRPTTTFGLAWRTGTSTWAWSSFWSRTTGFSVAVSGLKTWKRRRRRSDTCRIQMGSSRINLNCDRTKCEAEIPERCTFSNRTECRSSTKWKGNCCKKSRRSDLSFKAKTKRKPKRGNWNDWSARTMS